MSSLETPTRRYLMHRKRGRSLHIPVSPIAWWSLCGLAPAQVREVTFEVWDQGTADDLGRATCRRCRRAEGR